MQSKHIRDGEECIVLILESYGFHNLHSGEEVNRGYMILYKLLLIMVFECGLDVAEPYVIFHA